MIEGVYLDPRAVIRGARLCGACGRETNLVHVQSQTPICGVCAAFRKDAAREAIEKHQSTAYRGQR